MFVLALAVLVVVAILKLIGLSFVAAVSWKLLLITFGVIFVLWVFFWLIILGGAAKITSKL